MAELDDVERALAVAGEIEAAAEREGSVNSSNAAISHRAWIQARQGDLPGAVESLRPLFEMVIATGNPTFMAAQLFYLQDALLDRSGLDELVRIAKTMDLEEVGLAGTWMGAMVLSIRGRMSAAELDTATAVRDLRSALAIARGLSMGPAVSPLGSMLALALPADQAEEADQLVAEELEMARATGLDRPQGLVLRAAGTLASNQEGIPLLRESVALLDRCGARLEQARSLLALGGALRRSGARLEARTELTAAAELARECGADRLAQRALEELHAAGARPRREATTGPGALTASELRVARMAADGATTRDIAAALVVSTKTVETHLTHVYAKLGLSGAGARGRLAEALGEAA
jgi:DNA-binding CsgD family transcriptional regulator